MQSKQQLDLNNLKRSAIKNLKHGNFNLALSEFYLLIKLDGVRFAYLANSALIFVVVGYLSKASNLFKYLLKMNLTAEQQAIVYGNYGNCLKDMGYLPESIEMMRKSLDSYKLSALSDENTLLFEQYKHYPTDEKTWSVKIRGRTWLLSGFDLRI